MSEHNLTLVKYLPVPPEVVFDAWTTPEHMSNWFSPAGMPVSVPKLDLRVGGEYQVDMHGEGKDYVHTGKYIEIDRPNRLVFSWFSDGTEHKETIVTLDLKTDGDGTMLRLTHERFPSEKSRDEHNGGWSEILDRLESIFAERKDTGT